MKLTQLTVVAAIATCGLAFLASATMAQDKNPQPADSPSKLVKQFPAGQFVPMFDGKSLDGWRVIDKDDFERHGDVVVENGALCLGRVSQLRVLLGRGRCRASITSCVWKRSGSRGATFSAE